MFPYRRLSCIGGAQHSRAAADLQPSLGFPAPPAHAGTGTAAGTADRQPQPRSAARLRPAALGHSGLPREPPPLAARPALRSASLALGLCVRSGHRGRAACEAVRAAWPRPQGRPSAPGSPLAPAACGRRSPSASGTGGPRPDPAQAQAAPEKAGSRRAVPASAACRCRPAALPFLTAGGAPGPGLSVSAGKGQAR